MCRIIFFLFLVTVFSESVKLPSNFKKCNRKQPNLKECVLEATRHAIPQLARPFDNLNIPKLNPFIVQEVEINTGGGAVAVHQHLKNCKFYGFPKIQLDNFEFDFNKKTLTTAGVFPELTINCEYNMKGKILLLSIEGSGISTVAIENMKFKGILNYEEVKKKGKTHMKYHSADLDMNAGHVFFNFENLFNGDEKLSQSVNKVLNDNWKEVFEDVKRDYLEIVQRILLQLLNNFFAKVSIEEAFDD